MDTYRETSLKIDFAKGEHITVTTVLDGREQADWTFHKSTHQIEEVLDYINYHEVNCDVYF